MLALLLFITQALAFTSKAIFSNPATVQTQNVMIEFYAVPETTINALGSIQLTAPASITVHQPTACYDVLNKLPCTVVLSQKTFVITTSVKLNQAQQFQFRLTNAINNPISTEPTSSWSLLTSSGESLQNDMLLTATPGSSSLELQPVSTVVGASTNIVLKWTGAHMTPQGTIFKFTFPLWNPQSPQQPLPFFQGGVVCSPLVVLSSKLACSFQNNTLTLSAGVSIDIGAQTLLSIMVTGFKNPMDTSTIKGFTVSSLINNYLIDVGSGSLQVFDYAQITGGRLEVRYPDFPNAGLIQNTEDMKLSFFLPVPLNQGCQVTVVLPQQYNVTSVTSVSSLQLFGSYTQYSGSNLRVSALNNSFTFFPCDTYKTNQNQAVIYISQLTQYKYEKPTDSVQVQITNNGIKICQVQTGVTFLPTRGVADVTAIASNPQVAKPTSLSFSITPKHVIYAADAPTIMITFPTTVTGCTVNKGTCSRDQFNPNLIIIKNAITQDYKPGDPAISLTFTSVINPQTTKPMGSFELQILAQGKYVIDESAGTTPWPLQPGNITSVQVSPGSYQAYKTNNNYQIQFTPNNPLPLNAYFEIWFPQEILVPDISYSASSCTASQGVTISCQFNNTSSQLVLRVLNAFRIAPGQAGSSYLFTIPGVRNPIRTTPTGPFVIKTLTSDDYLIDQFVGSNIQMLIEAQIEKIVIQPSNYINSKPATLTVQVTPSVPVTNSNLLLITFPQQILLPSSDLSYNCSTTYSNLIQLVSCKTYNKNTVQISFVFAKDQGISESDTFGFSISGITNPPSTQTSDSLQFKFVDNVSYQTTNQMLFGVTITTSQPWSVANATVSLDTYQPGVPAVYTFYFTPEHQINTGGGVLITVPPQVSFDGTVITVVTVENSNTDQTLIYTTVSTSARQIMISNAIQSATKSLITVLVSGLQTPFSNQPTDSFQIRTFNQVNGLTYFIDAALEGLQIAALCSYPCNTCSPSQPSVCTSCFQQTSGIGLPYLQLGTCVSECNFGRFFNHVTQQCDLCDPSCLTCVNSAKQCTTCGNNQTPYYYNQQCLQSCPAGFLPNLQAYKCQPCASNCGTCTKTITTCTSCDQSSNQTLLYKNQCISQCPALISVQVGTSCEPCNPACKTCAGDPNQCMTCPSHKKFDPIGLTCQEQCKPQTQIYNPDLETCDPCNKTCSKCDGDVNKCTECKPGYVLNKDFTCQATCNDENLAVHQTGVNGICRDCEQPCNTCSKQVNYCTSCLQTPVKFYWHLQSQCVQYCPNKYNVTADGLACFYVGLQCPDRFKLDATGDGCVPELVECIDGYELNDQKTACIPLPGAPVPFPFLIAAVFVSFLVLGSHIKEKFYTKVYTCLIAIIGSFELVMYILIVAFSYHMGEWAIAALASVGTSALLTANVLFVVYYQRDILAIDTTYSKWLYFFPKTKGLIVPCCLINFKCMKILYSGFYGLESSMARFGRPLEFYRIVKMVTYFAYIFAYLFIFLADFVIFARVKWGYQLLVLGIETFILQIVIIVLTYLESKKDPEQLLSVGSTQYTTIKPKGLKEVNVKSAVEDSEDDDYLLGIPDVDEMVLIRSKEKHHQLEVQLRMLAFMNVIKNAHIGQTGLTKVQSKFDEDALARRRAFSLGEQDQDTWTTESCSSAEAFGRRRYSWPLTHQSPLQEEITKFVAQVRDIEKADDEYLIDNCYYDTRPPPLPIDEQKPKKFACCRTQTYLRELLQLDGYCQNDSLESIILDDDAEINDEYCRGLIDNVLSHVSGNEAQSDFQDPLNESFHLMEADFDLAQLIGDFEADDLGNFIIVKKAGSNILIDRQGRRVNRRGYLVDAKGNVINQQGHIIFKQYELDHDDELPTKFNQETLKQREKMQMQGEIAPVEAELSQYQETAREQLKVESKSSFDLASNDNDEGMDQIFQEVTTEKILRKQREMKRPSHQILNNYPPRRYGMQNSGSLYPFIEIDNEEQRRLAALTRQIGMQAQQRSNQGEPDFRQRVQQQKDQTLSELMSERHRASSVHDLSKKRPLTANRKARPPIDRNNLQKIYSNIDQLVGLDEPQLNQVQEQRPDTKRKSVQDSQRLAAVESIYLNKSANRAVTAKGARPSRPTLLQFQDDPIELNVDTRMNGMNSQQGRDVSLLMAERVDQIQKTYLKQMQSHENLSEYKLVLTDRQKPSNLVKHDNWLQ